MEGDSMKVVPINFNQLERKHYNSVDELVEEIVKFVSTGKFATLATDYRWWAKQVVDPHIGHVTNVSIGFEGNFLEFELLSALRKAGLYVSPISKWFYVIRLRK